MSAKYNLVKRYYDLHIWSITKVRNAVVHGWITAEEFETITGTPYSE